MSTGGRRVLQVVAVVLSLGAFLLSLALASVSAESLKEQNEALLDQIQGVHGLSAPQMEAVRAIFSRSPYIGQGNPVVTRHPVTPEQ